MTIILLNCPYFCQDICHKCNPQFLLRYYLCVEISRISGITYTTAALSPRRETDIVKTLKAHTRYSKYLSKHVVHVTILPITIITFFKSIDRYTLERTRLYVTSDYAFNQYAINLA